MKQKKTNSNSNSECNYFLDILYSTSNNMNFKTVFNEENIYNKKIINAYFIIDINNFFYLKVLKKHNAYHFELIPHSIEPKNINFYQSRDSSIGSLELISFFYTEINIDTNTFYPKNFEETKAFKLFYEKTTEQKEKFKIKEKTFIEFLIENIEKINQIVNKNN